MSGLIEKLLAEEGIQGEVIYLIVSQAEVDETETHRRITEVILPVKFY